MNPTLFREISAFALERYPLDRASYHVSAEVDKAPDAGRLSDGELTTLLDDFHAREILHVTFGSVLRHPDFRDPFFAAARRRRGLLPGARDALRQTLRPVRRIFKGYRGLRMDLNALLKMYDFTDRTIVVTGATGVLCGAMAKALVECGANVAILARSREKGEATLNRLSGPGRAMVVVGDALKQETLLDAARAALDEFGRIDGLINGAGGNILKPPPVKS